MFQTAIRPPLPDVDGPRLPYFSADGNCEPTIELLEVIGSGLHGHVVKAKVDGEIYAIKIFKFTDELNFFARRGEEDIEPPYHQIEAQCHPFGRECRAFARLKEVGKEHLAVQCYGYLVFGAAMERTLADQLGLDDWGRDPVWPEWEEQPLHAIVKEFLPKAEFSRRDAPKMIRNLKEIHQCGIIVNDVKYDAYVGARLVDFSFAVTTPHIQFDQRFGFNHSDSVEPFKDLCELDEEVFGWWNYIHRHKRKPILVRGYHEYDLRNRKELYEPKDFDWWACADKWTKLPRRSARIQKVQGNKPPVAPQSKLRRSNKVKDMLSRSISYSPEYSLVETL